MELNSKLIIRMSLVLILVAFFFEMTKDTFDPNEEFDVKQTSVFQTIINPDYMQITEASQYLIAQDMGVSYTENGKERFYPFSNQEWNLIHIEDEEEYLVTYCEICHIGVIYNPELNGDIYNFEPTAYSYGKNTVMQDAETESYWSQLFGEAIEGKLKGEKLEVIFHQNMNWEEWKTKYPNGEVMILN